MIKDMVESIIKLSELGDDVITSKDEAYDNLPNGAKHVVDKLEWAGIPVKINKHAATLLGLLAHDKDFLADMFLAQCVEKEKELITVETVKGFMESMPDKISYLGLVSMWDDYNLEKETNALDVKKFWELIHKGDSMKSALEKLNKA